MVDGSGNGRHGNACRDDIGGIGMVYVYGGTLSQTFGPGGAGASISALVATAVGGSFISMVLSAIGQGMASQMAKILTTLACIGIVVAAVGRTLGTLGISI